MVSGELTQHRRNFSLRKRFSVTSLSLNRLSYLRINKSVLSSFLFLLFFSFLFIMKRKPLIATFKIVASVGLHWLHY